MEDLDFFRTCDWWPEGKTANINAGFAGHDREIVVVIEGYDIDNEIPSLVVEAVAGALPDSWKVESRGTRIEVHPSGRFAGGFSIEDVITVIRALPEVGLAVGTVEAHGV